MSCITVCSTPRISRIYSCFVDVGTIVLHPCQQSSYQLSSMSMCCGLQSGLCCHCCSSCSASLGVRSQFPGLHQLTSSPSNTGILYFVRPNTKSHFWNYFLHTGLQLGVSVMVFVYATEFYARKTCVMEETLLSTFVPRFYSCFYSTS